MPANDQTGLLGLLQRDVQGFDLVRRRSVRGDVFAGAVADILAPQVLAGPRAFHQAFAEQMTSKPSHVSVLLTGAGTGGLAFDAQLVDATGRRLGGTTPARSSREIPFGDVLTLPRRPGRSCRGNCSWWPCPTPGRTSCASTVRDGRRRVSRSTTSAWCCPVPTARCASRRSLAWVLATGSPSPTARSDPAALHAVVRDASGGSTLTAAFSAVTDPPPTVLGARQVASADVAGCPLDPQRIHQVGRVIAVLFSEEVTPESAQDKFDGPASITNYRAGRQSRCRRRTCSPAAASCTSRCASRWARWSCRGT